MDTRVQNDTPGAIRLCLAQVGASSVWYLDKLNIGDRQETDVAEMRTTRQNERIERFASQGARCKQWRAKSRPDIIATEGKGIDLVGNNVQAAIDTDCHIVVAHEVTNVGHDRTQLANMGRQVKDATEVKRLLILADRGSSSGAEILACEEAGVTPICPKPLTSGAEGGERCGEPEQLPAGNGNDMRGRGSKRRAA